ncbi:MAG: hypothetical protein AVDCRST_MAG79-326, partial [uncultured Thermoleophilia bacterium]
ETRNPRPTSPAVDHRRRHHDVRHRPDRLLHLGRDGRRRYRRPLAGGGLGGVLRVHRRPAPRAAVLRRPRGRRGRGGRRGGPPRPPRHRQPDAL